MIRKIRHPQLADARKLTPMEMNNLHFRDSDNNSPRKATDKAADKKK